MGWLSGSPSTERSRSLLRCAWWRAILSGPSQFLRELHFIEARAGTRGRRRTSRRSSFGNCTSLRPHGVGEPAPDSDRRSSFGNCTSLRRDEHVAVWHAAWSQFLRELYFIEAPAWAARGTRTSCRSSFGNCTSLRPHPQGRLGGVDRVAVPSGTALH